MSLCPPYHTKKNFYLKSLMKPKPTQWYGNQVVGQNSLAGVVKVLMEEAGIEGFFTNHSLRRTGGTRLFHTGVDRKLVKEATGHSSDSIDAYQITSENQSQMLSEIIAKPPSATVSKGYELNVKLQENCEKEQKEKETSLSDVTFNGNKVGACNCQCNVGKLNVAQIVSEIMKGGKRGKTVIKLSVEISNK